MNQHEAVQFMFTIANEIKRAAETPVILLTMKDYADSVMNWLVEVRSALLQQKPREYVADIVDNFHLEWAQAVRDVNDLRRRARDLPRDYYSRAIIFTAECVKKRLKNFRQHVDKHLYLATNREKTLIRQHIFTIAEMQDSILSVLSDKQNCIYTLSDQTEFITKFQYELEELLNWLDNLNDSLAIQLSEMVGIRFPAFRSDLRKTLQQIVDEVSASSDPEAQLLAKELESKAMTLRTIVRSNAPKDLEILNILDKIRVLESRIDRLKNENSPAVMALQHKTIHLEERLMSLENLKQALHTLKNKRKDPVESQENVNHIFDHLLPPKERCRLVDDLMKLWRDAICSFNEGKSIISILSVADIKDIFSDDLGKFIVDKFGRKLYKGPDDSLYQVNERNELVPIKDEEKRVFFYDECGRYYINEQKERIYKAYDNASEYFINREGQMLKLKEFLDGREYYYDSLGRYYLNKNGKRVYCSEDGVMMEDDGLGNLVRVRSSTERYSVCPPESISLDENEYLRRTVGAALRKCIADVVLRQPDDPIQWLAGALERYWVAERAREERWRDEPALAAERARRAQAEAAYQASTAPLSVSSVYAAEAHDSDSYEDHNSTQYPSAASDL